MTLLEANRLSISPRLLAGPAKCSEMGNGVLFRDGGGFVRPSRNISHHGALFGGNF